MSIDESLIEVPAGNPTVTEEWFCYGRSENEDHWIRGVRLIHEQDPEALWSKELSPPLVFAAYEHVPEMVSVLLSKEYHDPLFDQRFPPLKPFRKRSKGSTEEDVPAPDAALVLDPKSKHSGGAKIEPGVLRPMPGLSNVSIGYDEDDQPWRPGEAAAVTHMLRDGQDVVQLEFWCKWTADDAGGGYQAHRIDGPAVVTRRWHDAVSQQDGTTGGSEDRHHAGAPAELVTAGSARSETTEELDSAPLVAPDQQELLKSLLHAMKERDLLRLSEDRDGEAAAKKPEPVTPLWQPAAPRSTEEAGRSSDTKSTSAGVNTAGATLPQTTETTEHVKELLRQVTDMTTSHESPSEAELSETLKQEIHTLAWYRDMTLWGDSIGIWITIGGLLSVRYGIARALDSVRQGAEQIVDPSASELDQVSLGVLYAHEVFHHAVESAAIRAQLAGPSQPETSADSPSECSGVSMYGRYLCEVVKPTKLMLPDLALEESLAQAAILHSLDSSDAVPDNPFFRGVSAKVLAAARYFVVEEFIPRSPGAYARGIDYLDPDAFSQGLRILEAQLHEGGPTWVPELVPEDFVIGSPLLDMTQRVELIN